MASERLAKRARAPGLDADVASLDLASLGGDIRCMTVAADSTRFVCTTSALFAITTGGFESLMAGHKTERGFKDGERGDARFNCPYGITVDDDGNLLVSDTSNHALRKVTRRGAVSTLAGTNVAGFADGGGAAARFYRPRGIVIDAQGTIFVAL